MSIKNKISAIVIAASLIVSSISPTFNALAETITGTYEYTSNEDTMLQNKDGFEFSDECFTRSSFLGCQHLEILSAQASLASDCRFGDAYSDYSHYPDNINSFLKKCGFSDVSDNKYYTLMSQKNSAAAAVGHMTVRQDGKDYTLLAIIPRSARYKQEWAGNFDVGDGEIHEGFKAGRDEILRYVKQYIQQNDISGDLKVWVAGHSRGAALSNQLGAFFAGGGIGYFGDNVSITPEDVYCYTFGTPRTIKNGADKNSELSVSGNRSDSAYAGDTPGAAYSYTKGGTVDIHDAAYGGIRNFVTGDDIFTYLPLELWGFEHYGTDISRDHNVVSADKMLAELSGISKYASDLYAAGKGADSFERKTFDLKTLSLVTDSKKHSAMDLQSFLAERINGLSQNARTNKAYVENDCQAALTAAAGLYGAVSDLDILDLPDEDINYLGTLLTIYLAYASERLQAEGRAENDAEAALITICEALEYLTGEKLDARTATVDDLLLYFAKYMTANENEPVADTLYSLLEDAVPEEQRPLLSVVLGICVEGYSYETGIDLSDGAKALMRACVEGPVSGCEAAQYYSTPKEVRDYLGSLLLTVLPDLNETLLDENYDFHSDMLLSEAIPGIISTLMTTKDDDGNVIKTYSSFAEAADDDLSDMLDVIIGRLVEECGEKYGAEYAAVAKSYFGDAFSNISSIRHLFSYMALYTGDKFDTGESIDNVSTIIGNISSVGISHFNEVYLAYAKAAKSYNVGYEEHRISKAPQSTNTHDKTAEGAPKTGDAGAALPVTAGAIAFVIVRVFRKKNDD